MDEMEIVRKITHLIYTHRKDACAHGTSHSGFRRRDLMMLDAIIRLGNEVKMSDLSTYFQITPAAVSQCVRNYEKKGWVERIILENDRRSVYIKVSDEAKELVAKVEEETKQTLVEFVSTLDENDAQAFVRILEKAFAFFNDKKKQ